MNYKTYDPWKIPLQDSQFILIDELDLNKVNQTQHYFNSYDFDLTSGFWSLQQICNFRPLLQKT